MYEYEVYVGFPDHTWESKFVVTDSSSDALYRVLKLYPEGTDISFAEVLASRFVD